MRARTGQGLFACVAALSFGCATIAPVEIEPVDATVDVTVDPKEFAAAPDLQTEVDAHSSLDLEPPSEARAEPPPAVRIEARMSELIAYLATVVRASPVAQKKELAQSVAAFGRTPTPLARLRLGGLYAQPTPALRDDTRALALLEPLAANGAPAPAPDRPVTDLASLLYAQVAERQRIEKEDARKHEELRERIEAMKSIERSILQREERQRTR